jgi:hypothetical protein
MLRLCEELIALREKNERQHKLFEQAQHAAPSCRTAQQLRRRRSAPTEPAQEIHGEKRISLAC